MGTLDVNNYKKAIEYYRQFLALNPSEEDKKDVNSKIDRAEYAIDEAVRQQEEIEKTDEISLEKLIGRWKFYWEDGAMDEYDFYDIEIFQNRNVYYVRYIKHLFISREITTGIEKHLNSNYATTEMVYDAGFISFEISNEKETNKLYKGAYDSNNQVKRKLNYELKVGNNILEGERFCTVYFIQEHFQANRQWKVLNDCEGDCGNNKAYFVKR
jgi:tetratricopeptide (TPR) repeat protein